MTAWPPPGAQTAALEGECPHEPPSAHSAEENSNAQRSTLNFQRALNTCSSVVKRTHSIACIVIRANRGTGFLTRVTDRNVCAPVLWARRSGVRRRARGVKAPKGRLHLSPGQAKRSPGYRRPVPACPERALNPELSALNFQVLREGRASARPLLYPL